MEFSLDWGFQTCGMWCCITVWVIPSILKLDVALIIRCSKDVGMVDQQNHTPSYPMFWFFLDYLILKLGALWSFEIMGTTYPTTECHSQEDLNLEQNLYENLQSTGSIMFSLELCNSTHAMTIFTWIYLCIMHMNTLQVSTKGRSR